MKCKSGKHEWLDPESAKKCCNGYNHILRIGSTQNCDVIGSDPLPRLEDLDRKAIERRDRAALEALLRLRELLERYQREGRLRVASTPFTLHP